MLIVCIGHITLFSLTYGNTCLCWTFWPSIEFGCQIMAMSQHSSTSHAHILDHADYLTLREVGLRTCHDMIRLSRLVPLLCRPVVACTARPISMNLGWAHPYNDLSSPCHARQKLDFHKISLKTIYLVINLNLFVQFICLSTYFITT
jgi:hypothetical protein